MKRYLTVFVMVCTMLGVCGCASKESDELSSQSAQTVQTEDSVPTKDLNEIQNPDETDEIDEPDVADETIESEEENVSEDFTDLSEIAGGVKTTDEVEGEEGTKGKKETPRNYSALSYEVYGDYEEVPIWTAFASSQLDIEEDYYKYHPEKLYDHDITTAYVEGEADNGIGQMVKFEFGNGYEASTYAITRIEFCPGYQKSKEVFENNSRPTKISFYFSDGSVKTAEFRRDYDYDTMYSFDIDPVIANECIMVIEDAVSGKKYNDCCISEVTFYSQQTDGMMYYEQNLDYESDDASVEADYTIFGYAGEELVWSYQTHNPLTELTSSAYLASGFEKVIVYDDQKVVALDACTGEKLWEACDTGFPSAVSFDRDGNFYVCSYYGSCLSVIDKDGNVIRRDDNLAGEDYTWACMLVLKENRDMSIYYARCGEDDELGKVFTTKY